MAFGLERIFSSRPAQDLHASKAQEDTCQDYDFKDSLYLVHYGELEGYLPSFDPACLSAYMLMRILGLQFTTETCIEMEQSPNGKLPFLMNGRGRCIPSDRLFDVLIKRFDQEADLETIQHYSDLITSSLRPVWMNAMWAEDTIRDFILIPLYASKSHCWLVRQYLLWRYRQSNARSPHTLLYDQYINALGTISRRLGERRYFGGDAPSALDACIGADLVLIPFFLPASHFLHKAFMEHHNLYEYSLHLLEYIKQK